MGTTRRKFTSEFKQEAVRLVTERGLRVSQAARDLDISENVLRRWMRELEQHGAKAFPGNGVPIEQELAQLRKEVETLRREREILKSHHFLRSTHYRSLHQTRKWSIPPESRGLEPLRRCSSHRLRPHSQHLNCLLGT
jgi:transposase